MALRDGVTANALPTEDIHDRSAVTDDKPASPGKEEGADDDGLFLDLKDEIVRDLRAHSDWITQADDDAAFVAGHQYTDEELQQLEEQGRPDVAFNRTLPTIKSIIGLEIGNRREVQYIPRQVGAAAKNEVLTAAGQWARDECDAEDEESDAFADTVVTGLGWVESRMSYDENPEGMIEITKAPYRECIPDRHARRRNLVDSRRVTRIRNMPPDDARAILAGVTDEEFEDWELDADWARLDREPKRGHSSDPQDAYNQDFSDEDDDEEGNGVQGKDGALERITLVHVQWWEHEQHYKMSWQGKVQTVTPDVFKKVNERLKQLGRQPQRGVKVPKKVFKQAWLGSRILWQGEGACPTGFTLEAMTGDWDPKEKCWYGIVRSMRDPQRWANKWLAQGMHIMNTSARNGYFAEEGVFENIEKAEQELAQTGTITIVRNGAIANQKLMPKAQGGFPSDMQGLMEFAISSIRDASGVNLELLGLKDNEQAGVLEAQRKQAGMTILATLFDALRRYRKRQGKTMLYFITNFLGDGRLIRIMGDEGAQYVPFIHQAGTVDFDVIVDDAPTSPNMKEQVWQQIIQILPIIGKNLGPDELMALAKWSPLPTSVIQDLQKGYQAKQQSQAPAQQAGQQLALQKLQGEVRNLNAQAAEREAKAGNAGQEGQINPVDQLTAAADVRTADAKAFTAEMGAVTALVTAMGAQAAANPQAADATARSAVEGGLAAPSPAKNVAAGIHPGGGDLGASPGGGGVPQPQLQPPPVAAGQQPAPQPQAAPAQPIDLSPVIQGQQQLAQMMQQLAATVMGQSQAIHSLAGAHQQLQSHVQGIADDMNAPTQIIRDEDGVPTHIKKGRNMRPVSLDANGRLTGA